MEIKRRIKQAIKVLLGKPIEKPVSKHDYYIAYSDKEAFDGKTALVTGGTGAIGSAICYELAAMGATVGICGRSISKIEETINRIAKGSPDVAKHLVPVVLDVNNDNQIEEAIVEYANNQGHLDVLINNAGGQPGRVGNYSEHLYEQSIEQIDLVLDTNLRGTIMCTRVAARIMAKQSYGHVISMASVIGMGGKGGYSDYAATKAAIIGFTKSMALEMSDKNVRVNCISPGLVNQTPFDGGSPARYSSLTALKRAGFTKEIADGVVFLMKNEFITGQNLVIDGGRSLGLFGDN